MQTRFRLLPVYILAISCIPLGGCYKFYGYRDVTISAQDAETGKPIVNARIDLTYRYMMVLNAPKPDSSTTDQNGLARMRAANFEMQEWKASANGYLSNLIDTTDHENQIDLRLYREAAPEINIVVPTDYRGPLMIDMRPTNAAVQSEIGQRQFKFHASANGYVLINATPLLLQMETSAISASFASGVSIPRPQSGIWPGETALRYITMSGKRYLFVIGTQQDEQKIYSMINDHKNGDPQTTFFNQASFNAMFEAAVTTQPTKSR